VEKKEDGLVEELALEFQIKHPLQNTWTLWYYENDRNKNWEENHQEITSFDTVEDFWR
jgi:translation initiation factor 4E